MNEYNCLSFNLIIERENNSMSVLISKPMIRKGFFIFSLNVFLRHKKIIIYHFRLQISGLVKSVITPLVQFVISVNFVMVKHQRVEIIELRFLKIKRSTMICLMCDLI
jgi:hypothetical protein